VRTIGEAQLVFVDLPGVQRPRDLLTERMAARVEREVNDSDLVLLVLAADQKIGNGDRFIAAALARARASVIVAVNKIDKTTPERTARALLDAERLGVGEEIFPISARSGAGLEELIAHLRERMPAGEHLFPAEIRSDQPRALQLAELIREALLRRLFAELPHATEVVVEELEPLPSGVLRLGALIWVETDSQRAIVIGARGAMIKAIGSAARRSLEAELGERVHLELSVRTRRHWRREPTALARLQID
jgi:GTP-binding protein Era